MLCSKPILRLNIITIENHNITFLAYKKKMLVRSRTAHIFMYITEPNVFMYITEPSVSMYITEPNVFMYITEPNVFVVFMFLNLFKVI
jgi:hypothetical protein